MNKLLEKRELRDLTILSLLYSEERWWNAEELAQKANCSVDSANKSVSSLIQISTHLEDAYQIISQKNKGIILHASSNYSIFRLESLYYQETISYQIIDKIFQSPDLTIEKLTEDLFLSKSTLYRKLKSIDFIFTQNNLELDKNNLKLIGSEINIREFYYIFYWSITRTEEWPFSNVPKELLDYRLKELMANSHLELSPIEEIQMYYRMAINFIQHQKKQFITELPEEVKLDPIRLEFLSSIAETLTANVPKAYQENEFNYLGLIFSTYPYMGDDSHDDFFEPIVAWYKANNTLTYRLTTTLIDELVKIYPDPLLTDKMKQPKVLFMLFSTANYALLFPDLHIHDELTSSWQKQLAQFKQKTPTFFQNLSEIVYRIQGSAEYDGKLMTPFYSLYAMYTIFQQNFDVHAFENIITIKLICATDPISESSLSDSLKNRVTQNLIIATSNTRNDHGKRYDLLLSDMQLPAAQLPAADYDYIWDFPPSQRDWNNITELLGTILKTKQARLD